MIALTLVFHHLWEMSTFCIATLNQTLHFMKKHKKRYFFSKLNNLTDLTFLKSWAAWLGLQYRCIRFGSYTWEMVNVGAAKAELLLSCAL